MLWGDFITLSKRNLCSKGLIKITPRMCIWLLNGKVLVITTSTLDKSSGVFATCALRVGFRPVDWYLNYACFRHLWKQCSTYAKIFFTLSNREGLTDWDTVYLSLGFILKSWSQNSSWNNLFLFLNSAMIQRD